MQKPIMAPSSPSSPLEDPARRRQRLLELTGELSDATTLAQVGTIMVDHGREALDAAMVGLWLASPRDGDASLLRWSGLDEISPQFSRVPLDREIPIGEAMLERAAIWLESRDDFLRRFPRYEAQSRGLSVSDELAFACLPLVTQGRALGAIALTFYGARRFDEEERTFLLVLARHGALAIERVLLAAAERRTNERLRLLADAGEKLAASLDLDATLRAVTEIVLPTFADFCAFDLFERDTVRRVAVAHGDPEVVRAAEALQARYPDNLLARQLAADVLRKGRARLIAHVTDEILRARASDEEHLAALRAFGFVSGILAPVMANGRVLGTLSFGMTQSGRIYDEGDLAFAEEIANRAALAVANAQLFHAERAARGQLELERAALAHSEALFRGAQDMSQEGFRLYRPVRDEDSRIVDFECIYQNATAGRLSSLGAEVAVGSRLLTLFPRATEFGYFATYESVASTGEPHLIERPYADQNVSGIFRSMVVRIGECVAVTFSDITEAQREEARRVFLAETSAALASSLDRDRMLRVLTESAVPRLADACTIDIIDGSGRIVRVAATMRDPAQQALAMGWWERFAPEGPAGDWVRQTVSERRGSGIIDYGPASIATSSPETTSILRDLGIQQIIVVPLAHGERAFGVASLLMTTSGRRFTSPDLALAEELARRTAIALENARLYGIAQEARYRAEQANRMKDEFLATVSHELRTPLNAIVGWSNILRGARLDDVALVAKGLDVIRRNADAQSRLIDDILDVSRIITGKLKIEPSPIDLRAIVEEALDVVRPSAEAKSIELSLTRGDAPALLVGDPERLRQALWNLLSNAIKFTDRGGRVLASIARGAGEIAVTIEDTGCGIDPAFLPHVFERFTQAEPSTSRRFGGLGLGLAIVRHIIELHGGSVWAESAGLRRGSTFRLTLPVRPAGSGATEARAGEAGAAEPTSDR